MQRDRRSAPRVKVNLPARWEGVLFHEHATVTNLSTTGCFVLSGGKVEVKELVWLEISLPHQDPLHIWAEVVEFSEEIGFAVRFNSISDEHEQRLKAYIATKLKTKPSK
ncbi:MAG: PilZ domain-containing protein [Pyrinomonadaceae bacterium]